MEIVTFGYGSNMLFAKMLVNVPSTVKICNGFITGYQFKFNKRSNKDGSGKGNITYTGNDSDIVWGVILKISSKDEKALDEEEGLGKGYSKINIPVNSEGGIIDATCYIAEPAAIDDLLRPYDWYRDMVVKGAIDNNLPTGYIRFLQAFDFVKDPRERRRNEKYAIING